MLSKKRIRFSNLSSNKLFLLKLYDILNDKESSDIIHWDSDGKRIVISNVNELCNIILPKYYKHTNYSSFVRQLNIYGFTKNKDINKINESECFTHEIFNKNITKEQIIKITRNNKKMKLLSNIIKKNREENKNMNEGLLLNEKDNILITLMNKIQNDEEVLNKLKNEISNIRNENLLLYEKFQIIKDKFIDHNIILKHLLKKFNIKIVNRKKSSNIKDLFKKYLYHLRIYSPFLTIKDRNKNNISYRKQNIESFEIYDNNNKQEINSTNFNYADSSLDDYPYNNFC